MEAVVDGVGRIVVPKPIRDALGLKSGSTVDLTLYGSGMHLEPGGRTGKLVDEDGLLVVESETVVTDDDIFGLLDSFRK